MNPFRIKKCGLNNSRLDVYFRTKVRKNNLNSSDIQHCSYNYIFKKKILIGIQNIKIKFGNKITVGQKQNNLDDENAEYKKKRIILSSQNAQYKYIEHLLALNN